MLAIIGAIDSVITVNHPEPTVFVTNRIIRKITKHLNKLLSDTATEERTQYKEFKKTGINMPGRENFEVSEVPDAANCGEELIQVIEAINASCNDDLDRSIANPHNSSMSDHELAKMFGVHRNTIVNRRAALLKRVEEKLNA
jgi:hypothetical protein